MKEYAAPFELNKDVDAPVYIHAIQFFTGYTTAHAMDIAGKIKTHHYDGKKISDVYIAGAVIEDDLHDLQELYAITIKYENAMCECDPITIRPKHCGIAIRALAKYMEALENTPADDWPGVRDVMMERATAKDLHTCIKKHCEGKIIDPKV